MRRSALAVGAGLALALAHAAPAEQALHFGVPGGRVEIPKLPLPADAKGLTVEFRFKALSSVRNPVTLVSRWSSERNDPDPGAFSVGLRPPNQIAFSLRNAKGIVKTVSSRGSWRDGRWHHVACVWDGGTATVLYDGTPGTSKPFEDFGALAPSERPLVVGPPPAGKNRRPVAFDGFITDVAVWSAARDAGAVAGSLAKPLAGSEPGLAACFPLREQAPHPTVRGRSPAGLEGRLVGALERTGWCATPMWHEPEPDRPTLHLFGYDLSVPARPDGDAAAAGIRDAARMILVGHERAREPGVLWQAKGSNRVFITWVDAALAGHRTIPLKGMDGGLLAAGTADAQGRLYYLLIQQAARNRPESDALQAVMHMAKPDGKAVREIPLDVSKDAFNIYAYGGRWGGSMACGRGLVGLILPRTMHMSGDGLRHQAAVAATFAPDLSGVKRLGHTSSHSFGNVLTANARGELIGIDLGDNYPRGVHLHKIRAAGMASRVVFTYKTAHGRSARGGSPVYREISRDGRTFYKWSNDNATYTELGGVVEGRASYTVIFATDRSPAGKVLDNSRIGIRDDPRDLAMLRVSTHFEKAPGGDAVSDSVMAGLPPGSTSETGGFYDFGGTWRNQRITGVIWLTNHKSGEAAHAPQPAKRRDGSVLIVWEKTGGDGGPSLVAMAVHETGKVVMEPVRLGLDLRLNRETLPIRLGNRIFLLARNRSGAARLCFVND
jgi:hypothetical protein